MKKGVPLGRYMRLLASVLAKAIGIQAVLKITQVTPPFIFVKLLEDIFPKDKELEI